MEPGPSFKLTCPWLISTNLKLTPAYISVSVDWIEYHHTCSLLVEYWAR